MQLLRHLRRSKPNAVAIDSPAPARIPIFDSEQVLPIELELSDRTVYARVARHHAKLQPGVVGFDATLAEWLRGSSGVSMRITRNGALDISVRIHAEYGVSLPALGRCVQEAVARAMRRLSDRPIHRIEIQIAGIADTDEMPPQNAGE